MWPIRFQLDVGASFPVDTAAGRRAVTLLAVKESHQPDLWCEANSDRQSLAEAAVTVDVSGEQAVLRLRPYEMPAVVNGLRLYVEATRNWAHRCELAGLDHVTADAALSALCAAEPWGPPDLVFPLGDYRWRAATYMNTWASLVPYNKLYYHRGEDYGAMPDHLAVLAALPGSVTASPLPDGDGRSNVVAIQAPGGITVRYAHMNIESVEPDLAVGAAVEAGRRLGRSGMTWCGRPSQTHDPHLHVSFHAADGSISAYPFLASAYLRGSGDALLPVAGGYSFALPGQTVVLDGSRSLAAPGRRIAACSWTLHDGTVVEGPVAAVACDAPGLFSERLTVVADDGSTDHDFAQLRVYGPARGGDLAFGWLYYHPLRQVLPGTPVRFAARFANLSGPMAIDFGDGWPGQLIDDDAEHAYRRPGTYVVSVHGVGPAGQPVQAQVRVHVDSA